jgi:hypothetical protein
MADLDEEESSSSIIVAVVVPFFSVKRSGVVDC